MAIYHTEKERVEAFKKASVYPVVTTDFCAGRNPLDVVRSILEGGAKVVQVREKTMCDRDYLNLLKEARKLTDEFGALLSSPRSCSSASPHTTVTNCWPRNATVAPI